MFEWNWYHVEIHLESMGIVETIGHPEFVMVLHHLFWADGPCNELESIKDMP
jgi:hypothetical protein